MGQIPEALSRGIQNNGSEIFLNSVINRIVVADGCVQGLEVEGQGVVEADAVIWTVDGMITFGSLLDQKDVLNSMRRKVQTAPLSHKAFVMQLGLSNHVDVESHSNLILPMMSEQYQVFMPQEDEVKWPMYSVPTVTVPGLAPQGGSIIEMFPSIRQDTPAEYWDEQRKERLVELAVKAVARLHKIDIAVTRVTSPKEFQDRMHLYKGAAFGLSRIVSPGAQFSHDSSISGLYQAGQTTYPGFGVNSAAMSGILAAETLMRKERMD